MLQVVVLICAIGAPRCDEASARVYRSSRAPEGFVICAGPTLLEPAEASLAPTAREERHVRCVWRRR